MFAVCRSFELAVKSHHKFFIAQVATQTYPSNEHQRPPEELASSHERRLSAGGCPAIRQQLIEMLNRALADAGEHVLNQANGSTLASSHEVTRFAQHHYCFAARIASHEGPVVAFPRDVALDVVVADQKIALFQVPSSQRVQFFSPLHRIHFVCDGVQFPAYGRRPGIRFVQNAVDKIEDTLSPEFYKVQQRSTSCPHLIETEAAENKATFARGPKLPWAQVRYPYANLCIHHMNTSGRPRVQGTGKGMGD